TALARIFGRGGALGEPPGDRGREHAGLVGIEGDGVDAGRLVHVDEALGDRQDIELGRGDLLVLELELEGLTDADAGRGRLALAVDPQLARAREHPRPTTRQRGDPTAEHHVGALALVGLVADHVTEDRSWLAWLVHSRMMIASRRSPAGTVSRPAGIRIRASKPAIDRSAPESCRSDRKSVV